MSRPSFFISRCGRLWADLAGPALTATMAFATSVAWVAMVPGTAHATEPRTVVVAQGLVNPWGLAFLPDGRMLVTERPGRLRLVSADGKLGPPLPGLPGVVAEGQGGLLDVVVDPRFASNRLVY